MLVETRTATVYVAHGRRYLSKAAAYLALARRRAERLAEHHSHYADADGIDDPCGCRVCEWRSGMDADDPRTPPPQLRRYARKMAAHDRGNGAGREETRG